jgi:peptidoglycan/LPS O-acetylase OafA/YrhL
MSRLSRLLPLYWIVATITLIAEFLFATRDSGFYPLAKPLAYASGVNFHALPWPIWTYIGVSELTTLGTDTGQWLGFSKLTGALGVAPDFVPNATSVLALSPVPPAWSIGLELTFYLIAPFIVLQRLRVIGVLIIASLGFRYTLAYAGFSGDPWNRSLFLSELMYFLLGVLSFRLYVMRSQLTTTFRRTLGLLPILTAVLINPAFAAAKILLRHYDLIMPDFLITTFPYLLVAIGIPFLFERSKDSLFDLRIGNLSYPIYISHMMVLGMLQLVFPTDSFLIGTGWVWLFWNIAWVCVIALVLDRLIAAPIDEWRKRFGARAGEKFGRTFSPNTVTAGSSAR